MAQNNKEKVQQEVLKVDTRDLNTYIEVFRLTIGQRRLEKPCHLDVNKIVLKMYVPIGLMGLKADNNRP